MFRSTIFRNFLLYSFGALVLRGVSFLLLPVYTRLLSPADYGRLELVLTLSYTLELLFSWGLLQVLQMDYYKFDEEQRKTWLARILAAYTFLSLIAFSGSLLAVHYRYSPSESALLLMPALAASFLNFYLGFLLIRLRFSERPKEFTFLQIGLGVMSLLLNLLLVVYFRMGILGILYSNLLTVLAGTSIFFFRYREGIRFRFSFLHIESIKGLLRYGLLFLPGLLSYWLMSSIGRWFLAGYAGVEQVGYYSVATRFSFIVEPLLLQPMLNAWTPRMMKGFSEGRYDVRISRFFPIVLLIAVLIGLLLQWMAGWVVDDKFHAGLGCIPLLVVASGCSFLAQASAQLLIYRRKLKYTITAIVTGLSVAVLSNYLLVQTYGVLGAAGAIVIGNLTWLVIVNYLFARERRALLAGAAHANGHDSTIDRIFP